MAVNSNIDYYREGTIEHNCTTGRLKIQGGDQSINHLM